VKIAAILAVTDRVWKCERWMAFEGTARSLDRAAGFVRKERFQISGIIILDLSSFA